MSRFSRLFFTFAALAVLVLPSANCAKQVQELKTAYSAGKAAVAKVAGKTIDRKYGVAAAKITNTLISTGDQYLQLPICNGGAPFLCRNSAATKPLIQAKMVASKARNDLLNFMLAHPGPIGTDGAYQALILAWSNLQGVFTTYGVNFTIPRRSNRPLKRRF